MFLWPILILYLARSINEKQFKIQFLIFVIISILVVIPYIVQIKYTTNAADFDSAAANLGNWKINSENRAALIAEDLEKITSEYPDEIFLVGNDGEEYAGLAHIYWGDDVKEFVSMQDYNLYLKNDSTLFEKKITFAPRIQDRRQIWIGGGLEKNENDATNYTEIKYGIGVGEPLKAEGFELVKSYKILYLSEKDNF